MILVGIGANLPLNNNEAPRSTCGAALEKLQKAGIKILKRSAWYKSAPVPISNAPWYVNGVVEIETELSPSELLFCFHKIEAELGRDRPFLNALRTLDLDILTYHEQSISPDQSSSSNWKSVV